MYKNINNGKKSIENSSPLYQTYTPIFIWKNINPIVYTIIQGASGSYTAPNIARRTSCKACKLPLIFLSLECKSDIKEAHCILSNPCEGANNSCFKWLLPTAGLYNKTVKGSIIMMIHWCNEPKQAPNASNVGTLTFLLRSPFLRNTSAPQAAPYKITQRNVMVVWLR